MGIEASVLMAYAAVAAAATGVYSAVSANNQDTPSPQALPEAPTQAEAQDRAKEGLDKKRRGAVGKKETISAGLLTEEADTKKKTLLG